MTQAHRPTAPESNDQLAAELREAALNHLWYQNGYAWEAVSASGGVVIMDKGEGAVLTDITGHSVLDFTSGLWLANAGYGRAEIADAMATQAKKLQFARHLWPTEPAIRAASKLAELAPGSLSMVFFTTGGGESNETALKIAIQYHRLNGEPDRTQFIGRDFSYHGASFATMSVGGARLLNRSIFQSHLHPNVQLIEGPGHPEFSGDAAARLEEAILRAGPDKVAAFIGEPISNSAGIHVPAAAYWPAIRAVCDRYRVLLICDEVITGFGRTGKMFAVEHWGIVPDILTIAKGATSGYAPLGAAIVKSEIAERFRPGAAEAFQHVITYGGQAVACAAALANIAIIERENLVERSARLGEYFRKGLYGLDNHPSFGEVRGLGLMCALQLTKNRDGRESFTPEERAALTQALGDKFYRKGMNVMGSVDKIALMPPLVITHDQLDRALGIVDSVLTDIEREFRWWH
jgi:adenosylmethionine-8-amino-7-oxononanoate aminotransferase